MPAKAHINTFLLAFKPAVCSKPSKGLFGAPTPQAKHQGPYISIAFYIAFYRRSTLPFAGRQTLQTLHTLQTPFWHPQPRRQRHQGPYIRPRPIYQIRFFTATKPAHISNATATMPAKAHINSVVYFCPRQQCQPRPFWHPQPRRQRHQGPYNQSLFIGVQACHLPAVKPSIRSTPSKRLFGTPNPAGNGTKAHISIAFYWRSSLPFARPPNPPNAPNLPNAFLAPPYPAGIGTKAHISESNSFLFHGKQCQTLQTAFLAPPTPQAKAPRPIYQ